MPPSGHAGTCPATRLFGTDGWAIPGVSSDCRLRSEFATIQDFPNWRRTAEYHNVTQGQTAGTRSCDPLREGPSRNGLGWPRRRLVPLGPVWFCGMTYRKGKAVTRIMAHMDEGTVARGIPALRQVVQDALAEANLMEWEIRGSRGFSFLARAA